MSIAIRNVATIRTPRKNKKYSIIIPAAGMGTRMLIHGPKPLVKIYNQQTILHRQLELIHNTFHKYEIVLVTGFEHNKIVRKIPGNIINVFNTDYEHSNVAYSIGLGLYAATTDNVLILYGDLVFNQPMLKCPFDIDSMAIVCNARGYMDKEIGCIIDDKKHIAHMFYNLPQKWAQILYLTGRELDLFRQFVWTPSNKMCYGFEAVNHVIDKGGIIKAHTPKHGWILDIDSTKDLQIARGLK